MSHKNYPIFITSSICGAYFLIVASTFTTGRFLYLYHIGTVIALCFYRKDIRFSFKTQLTCVLMAFIIFPVLLFFMNSRKNSGLYNLGTGTPRTFLNLTNAVFKSLDLTPDISYIDTPLDIRDKYQYYTCANMEKLKKAGYNQEFISLEEGVRDYVTNYLIGSKNF